MGRTTDRECRPGVRRGPSSIYNMLVARLRNWETDDRKEDPALFAAAAHQFNSLSQLTGCAYSVEADRYGPSKLNRCYRIALGLIRRLEFDDGWPEGDGSIGKSRQVRERIRGRELSA
jgi:hypothetical protein